MKTKRCLGDCDELKTKELFSEDSWRDDKTNVECVCLTCRALAGRKVRAPIYKYHSSIGTCIRKAYEKSKGDSMKKNGAMSTLVKKLVKLIKTHHPTKMVKLTENNYQKLKLLISNYKSRNSSQWNMGKKKKKKKARRNGTGPNWVQGSNRGIDEQFVSSPATIVGDLLPTTKSFLNSFVSKLILYHCFIFVCYLLFYFSSMILTFVTSFLLHFFTHSS